MVLIKRGVVVLLVLTFAAACWFVYDKIAEKRDRDNSPTATAEPSHSDLQIFDNAGDFGGTITIRNRLARDVEVFVEVDIYDGEQNVGDLLGSVSLKANSESSVDLQGFDGFVEFTDTRVHLTGFER